MVVHPPKTARMNTSSIPRYLVGHLQAGVVVMDLGRSSGANACLTRLVASGERRMARRTTVPWCPSPTKPFCRMWFYSSAPEREPPRSAAWDSLMRMPSCVLEGVWVFPGASSPGRRWVCGKWLRGCVKRYDQGQHTSVGQPPRRRGHLHSSQGGRIYLGLDRRGGYGGAILARLADIFRRPDLYGVLKAWHACEACLALDEPS